MLVLYRTVCSRLADLPTNLFNSSLAAAIAGALLDPLDRETSRKRSCATATLSSEVRCLKKSSVMGGGSGPVMATVYASL